MIIARKVFRIGRQTLSQDTKGRYYVSIKNRSYYSRVRIPDDKVSKWLRRLS